MFGYVIANTEIMSEADKTRYKQVYCGLCRALKARHGQLARMTLTYDTTFLVLVLGSLYEPEECAGCERCALHPRKKHNYVSSPIFDYAADMNVALAYQKQLDDWRDEKDLLSLISARLLRKKYELVAARYPRQCAAMENCMAQLSELERAKSCDPDAGAKLFGVLMGELFVWKEDRWADTLRSMAGHLGEFIYIMDAVVDLPKDKKRHRFNPLAELAAAGRGDAYFKELLTMLIGECTMDYDRLPLVTDEAVLRNILCSGVWTKYEMEMTRRHRRVKGERPNEF